MLPKLRKTSCVVIALLSLFLLSSTARSQSNINDGPGGPILVITSSSNPFSFFTAEMLRAEGWNEFKVLDISAVTSTNLATYDVVVLGDIALTAAQVTLLTNWTNAGGTLITFGPDKQLASLLGLTATTGTLSDGYIYVNTSSAPGNGITFQTMQFHGSADLYTVNAGTTVVATLFSSATAATSNPAVTVRNVGTAGGQAIAFTYDLARSVVYTRQGNPAWAGQKRDGQGGPIRSDDIFYPNWLDMNKVAIPQADEQMRLLSNIIVAGNADKKPLPRFWFLPKGKNAAVVMTGDDHAILSNSTVNRFDQYVAATSTNTAQDVLDWNAVRATSYLFNGTSMTDAQVVKYQNLGFELGLHLNTNCSDYTASTWNSFWSSQWSSLKLQLPSLSGQVTHRTHCIAWSDWATQPKVEKALGIRFDVNYYYWPDAWVNDHPGMFTGSGMPMRFADQDGTLLDIYQATTQMTDESGQTYPKNITALLDSAVGTPGYYGVFVANMHTDIYPHAGSDAIVSAALARQVPVVSARQMLDWVDGRNASTFTGISWSGNTLGFTVTQDSRARNMKGMLPTTTASGTLTTLTRGGTSVAFTKRTVKGVEYAFFDVVSGTYAANYGSDVTPPTISAIVATPNANGTAVITWTTNEASDSRVDYGTASGTLNLNASDAGMVTSHSVTLTGLTNNTTYYFRVSSKDAANNSATSPASPAAPLNFTVPAQSTGTGSTYNIFSTTPTFSGVFNDGTPLELGVKFRVTSAGTVTGVRFYKVSGNTGTHTGRLYSSTGTLLASAVFTNETASGWQTVTFSTPVTLSTGTTYVASYHSSAGNYSAISNYFNTAVVNGPVRGLADGEDGVNGVYRYTTTPAFPSSGYQKSNYGVDVVFATTATDQTAPVISNVSAAPNSNGTAVITWTTDEASDSRVDFGTTNTTLGTSLLDANMVTSHSITVSGLTNGTTYYYRVTSKDASNNSATSPLTTTSPANFIVPTAVDQTPPTISAVAAAPNSNGTATITWTTNEASDTRVDYGTASGTLNLNASNATLVTAHSITLSGLTSGTTYYYRVTSKDASNNSATSPVAANPAASFTMPTTTAVAVCGTDDTNTQFSSGTLGTALASVIDSNGALILKPTLSEDFTATTAPAGWASATWQSGGSVSYGGMVTVNGSHVYTSATYAAGASLEFYAKFTTKDFQNVGFSGSASFGTPWVAIGRGAVGTGAGLYVRTSSGVNTLLSSTLLNAYHRYKIMWNSTNFTIWVDGVQVATATQTITTAMNVQISDFNTGTSNLAVDWVRVSPYVTTGTFTSRVIDAGSTTFWKSASWNQLLPTGTSIAISYRTGNTATPDGTWSAWNTATNGGAISGNTRYLQYQAVLTTTVTASTPVLKDISFSCSASAAVVKLKGSPIVDQTPASALPSVFELEQNRPNPFHATTVIRYTIPSSSKVRITVWDMYGRLVKVAEEGMRTPGRYTLDVDMSGMGKGVYIYRMQAGDFTATRKMIVQ